MPDGSVVELELFEKWLNSSITAGWKVGVGMQSGRGQPFILGTRERLQPEVRVVPEAETP